MTTECIEMLRVALIDAEPQVREAANDDSIRNLAVTMNDVGLEQPIRVRRAGERFVVIDGERRLHAARLLKWEAITAIVEGRELNSAEITRHQLIANCMRKALSPIEIGRAIEALMNETGWTATEVARKLGFSDATVSKYRSLANLPASIQTQVENGSLPASTAYALGKVNDAAKQAELLQEAVKGELTRDAAIAKAKQPSRPRKSTKRRRTPNVTAVVNNHRVSMAGVGLGDLRAVISLLEELLGKAKAAESEGVDLEKFLRNLKGAAAA